MMYKVEFKKSAFTLSLIFLFSITSMLSAFAKTDSCGSAKAVSGTSCENLMAEFDVSKCESVGGPKTLAGKSECKGDRARVTVFSENFRYRAEFKKSQGEWDAVKWQLSGEVRRKYLKSEHEARHERKSKRTIASQSLSPSSSPKEVSTERETPHHGAPVINPTVTPVEPSTAAAPPLAISALVDAYYGYNFNRPAAVSPRSTGPVENQNIPQGNTGYRFFDNFHNDFGLNLLELTIKKSGPEVSFVADLDFGNVADYNASASVNNNTQTVIDEVSKHIGQAVISYTPAGNHRWTFEAGKLITHVGYETYKSRDDWQYSRSTLAGYGLPFWHVGVHAAYAVVPEKLTTSVYVYNGWNSIYETNSAKTLGFQAKWTPSADLTVLYNTIAGPENPNNNGAWRYLHEANATWVASQRLSFALETLYAWENRYLSDEQVARWGGSTFHIKWNVTEKSYLSPRFEFYRDIGGLTLFNPGVTQTIRGVTMTHGVQLAQGLDSRLEARWDSASGSSPFQSYDGMKNSQTTLSAAILYSL
jgi:hypothetical protein